nr:glycerate kinase [Lachnospiraceae bacterium]
MKVVIAMDSFKGSMTSMEAGNAAREGVLAARPDAEVIVRPLSDGGEGMTEALMQGLGGERIFVEVSDPLGRKRCAEYCIAQDGRTAVIEMAQAAGLPLLSKEQQNPFLTTTYGVGEMIADAIKKGCRNFLVGIGGSATNDGGMGMLTALGYRFSDRKGKRLSGFGKDLGQVQRMDDRETLPELKECSFKIACDVDNPLCGKQGATFVYAPQKGLRVQDCSRTDADMASYAEVIEQYVGKSYRDVPGAGAAGGMGFAFASVLKGELLPGADLVMQMTGLEKCVKDADIFLTGEGRMDGQSERGKAPVKAARLAKKYNCSVWVFAGQVTESAERYPDLGIDAVFAISSVGISVKESMQKDTAIKNMTEAVARQFADAKKE